MIKHRLTTIVFEEIYGIDELLRALEAIVIRHEIAARHIRFAVRAIFLAWVGEIPSDGPYLALSSGSPSEFAGGFGELWGFGDGHCELHEVERDMGMDIAKSNGLFYSSSEHQGDGT